MSRGLDFFDVDHTITRHSTGRHFAIIGIRTGLFPINLLFMIPLYYFYYRFGNLKINFFNREFIFLKGIPQKTFHEIANISFKKRLKKDIYPRAISLIQELKSSGRRVVFATSSPDIVVKPLADYLGIDEVLATSLEFKKGFSTGRFRNVPLFEHEKKKRVLDYIRSQGFKPADCSFYSDSIHDLPLLKAIGNPIVVNPDLKLNLAARRRGWTIIKFS